MEKRITINENGTVTEATIMNLGEGRLFINGVDLGRVTQVELTMNTRTEPLIPEK
jgi:hypothetical protein